MRERSATPLIAVVAIIAIALGVIMALRIHAASTPQMVTLANTSAADVSGASYAGFNPAAIYQARAQGVVTIEAVIPDSDNDTITGTGFVVNKQGYVLTASHVVHDYTEGITASAIYVDFASHDRVVATLVGMDQFSDVAVLKVDPHAAPIAPLPMGNSDAVTVGEPVLAIGSPFGNQESLSQGIVSAVHRTPPSLINNSSVIADAIQTDAAINHGNSGGPLFDAAGKVIGINQQIKSTASVSDGVAFAIPETTFMRSFHQIIDTGHVSYAHIGVVTDTVTPQLANAERLGAPHGVVIEQATGPAATAGLRGGNQAITFEGQTLNMGGDEVVAIGGQPIASSDDVTRVVNRLDPGKPVQITYYRGARKHTTLLTPTAKAL